MVVEAISINGEMFQNFTMHFGDDASLQCNAPGVQALASSWFTCFVFRLPFYLEQIQFNYITFGLNILVIMISMFGGLQDNCYKYIFMAQAFWDMFVAYDFTCYKPTLDYFLRSDPKEADKYWNHGPTTCFYAIKNFNNSPWMEFLFDSVIFTLRYCPFYPVLLFACVFFKFVFRSSASSGMKIFMNIFATNIISLLIINFVPIYSFVRSLMAECIYEKTSQNPCFSRYGEFFHSIKGLKNIRPIFSLCCLALAAVLIVIVAVKVFRSFKRNNDNAVFSSSIQILSILIIQFVMTTLCFSFVSLIDFFHFWGEHETIIQNLITCLSMLRSFVNSVAILTVISGYRNAIIDLFISLKMGVIYFAKTLIFDDYPSPQRRSATIHCSNDSNDSDYEFDSVHVRYIPIDHV